MIFSVFFFDFFSIFFLFKSFSLPHSSYLFLQHSLTFFLQLLFIFFPTLLSFSLSIFSTSCHNFFLYLFSLPLFSTNYSRVSEDFFPSIDLSGNFTEKNDSQTGPLGFSIYLSDTVRHFKNVQNTYNSGHISQNNTKNNNDNDYNNNNTDSNNNNINKTNKDIKKEKTKETKNFTDENAPKVPGIFGVNGTHKILEIKEYILEIRKDVENFWINYEKNTVKNDNTEKYLFPCFSTSVPSSSSTSSVSTSFLPFSPSTSSNSSSINSNFAESLKVKVFLRTRADGPTKVNIIIIIIIIVIIINIIIIIIVISIIIVVINFVIIIILVHYYHRYHYYYHYYYYHYRFYYNFVYYYYYCYLSHDFFFIFFNYFVCIESFFYHKILYLLSLNVIYRDSYNYTFYIILFTI